MRRRSSNAEPNLSAQFEGLRNDYAAAKTNRFRRVRTGLSAMGSHADWHLRAGSDYFRMMEYARDMDRNDSIVGTTMDRATTNIVQDGIRVDPQTPDQALNADLKARFNEWAGDPQLCDAAGEHTWWEMQWFACRHALVDGDILSLGLRSGHLEQVEAHRCRTPSNTTLNVVLGVKLNKDTRRREEYWLTKEDVSLSAAVAKVSDVKRYPTYDADGFRQIFHTYLSRRVSQTRGVTALAPVFDVAGMCEDVNFATLVRAQMTSCFAVFRERESSFSQEDVSTQHGARTEETLAGGTTRILEGIGPGMEIVGNPGEKLRLDSPHVPGAEFFPHMKFLLTIIGINLGLPLCILLLDASETNFSGFRGAVDQAKMGWKHNQRRLRDRHCQPVYEWKLRQFAAADPALRRAAERWAAQFYRARWNPPTWVYIQPLQDASANLLRLRNGLISRRRWAGEEGMDAEDLTAEIVADNAALIEAAYVKAEELNKKYPDLKVSWREVASLPTPDGINITVADQGDAVGGAAPAAPAKTGSAA